MIAIVESRADDASVRICERLRRLAEWERHRDGNRPDGAGGGGFYRLPGDAAGGSSSRFEVELRSFDGWHLELERPADAFSETPALLVFASRHSGDTGALLTGHHTGNFGPATFGGADHELAQTAPNALSHLLDAFDRHAPDGYGVAMECTHHGPTDVGCPSLFAELGSDEEQWEDPAGVDAVARSILDLRGADPRAPPIEPAWGRDPEGSRECAANEQPAACDRPRRTVVGIGGDHYVPRFERIVRETSWTVGHVASEWALDEMGDPGERQRVFEQAFETSESALAVFDGAHPEIRAVIEGVGGRIVSETWLREVDDRPLELVAAVESILGPIDTGVRFGRRDPDGSRSDGELAVWDLPTALRNRAEGIDADAVWDAVEARTVAFETRNGSSRVGNRVAVPEGTVEKTRRFLLDTLASVLETRYDEVRIDSEGGLLIAQERTFDPELASELGVPEGPAFGRLANGESVTVDGSKIDPRAVTTERTDRFPTE